MVPDEKTVLLGEQFEIGQPGHGAVVVHDLGEHAGRVVPGEPARSTAASVWPARFRTPPGSYRSGYMCPGRARSSGLVSGSTTAWMVSAPVRGRDPGGGALTGVDATR